MFRVSGLIIRSLGLLLICSGVFAEHETRDHKTVDLGSSRPTDTKAGETKESSAKAKFTRVSAEELKALGVKETTAFGEAWKDPSGVIWGDIAKKQDGSPRFMNYRDAAAYCRNLGARLPTGYTERNNGQNGFPKEDSDFVRLSKYFGGRSVREWEPPRATPPEGYAPQILPNLTYIDTEGKTVGHIFRSSSLISGDIDLPNYVFESLSGGIGWSANRSSWRNAVRCVIDVHR